MGEDKKKAAWGGGDKEETKPPDKLVSSDDTNKQRHGGRSAFNKPGPPKVAKFLGRCEDLTGHIYDVSSNRQAADTFAKTTREIGEYIGRTYKSGADTRLAIKNLKEPTIDLPTDPASNATKTEERIWKKEVSQYVKQKIKENLKTAYLLIYGQCTDALRAKLEAQPEEPKTAETSDVISLLKTIKAVKFNFQGAQKYALQALHEAK